MLQLKSPPQQPAPPQQPEPTPIEAAPIDPYPSSSPSGYSPAGRKRSDKTSILSMSLLLFLGVIIFITWAAFFEIDQAVRAHGQIIASARTQIIQVADGGVLSELLVKEGESVEAGQLIAVLEKERSGALFNESRSRVASLGAALVRARAEASGTALVFGEEFDQFADFITVQTSLYEQRKQGLNDELHALETVYGMAKEEREMHEALLETGDVSRLEVMRTLRQESEAQGDINAVRNQYLQDAREEVTKLEADLDFARYKLEERKSVLGHTNITAPVTGVVKYLRVNTQGGVLRAGDELLQISPTESKLVVEVKVAPIDIGQLKLGLPVSIKLDAFDYSIYGNLHGQLSYLSSDTLTEKSNNGGTSTFYLAQVEVDKSDVSNNPKLFNVSLLPGMTTTIDIQTGRRSVLNYIAKPITRAFGGALRER